MDWWDRDLICTRGKISCKYYELRGASDLRSRGVLNRDLEIPPLELHQKIVMDLVVPSTVLALLQPLTISPFQSRKINLKSPQVFWSWTRQRCQLMFVVREIWRICRLLTTISFVVLRVVAFDLIKLRYNKHPVWYVSYSWPSRMASWFLLLEYLSHSTTRPFVTYGQK